MKPFLTFLILMSVLSCSGKSRYETMEMYFKNNNNQDVNLLRIGTVSYYPVLNILSANGGIITSDVSDFSKVSLKTEIKNNSTLSRTLDDFKNYRSDIIIISYSDYMKHFDSLKYSNPRVFAVSALSTGSIAIEGNNESFKKKKSVSIKNNDNSYFTEFYCKLNNVNSETKTEEIISAINLNENTPSGDIISSTSSFPYFEPYIMISRKYFISDRSAAIAKFLKALYEFQSPKDDILSSSDLAIDKTKVTLTKQASITDAKLFFGESPLSPDFIKLFKIRGGRFNDGKDFLNSFEPFFILSADIKQKVIPPREFKTEPLTFDLIISAGDGIITSEEIYKIEFYTSAASTMRNVSIKIASSGFTDYDQETRAIRRVKEKIISYGFQTNNINESRIRNKEKDKKLTITFESK